MFIRFVVFLLLYYLLIPIVIGIGKMIVHSLRKNRRLEQKKKEIKLSYLQRVKRQRKYVFSEYKHSKRMIALMIFMSLLPAICSLFEVIPIYVSIALVVILPFVYNRILSRISSSLLSQRDKVMERFIELKRLKMGLIDNETNVYDYARDFEILDWGQDGKIDRFRIFLPVSFDPLGKTKFLNDLSVQLGRGRPFEVDMENKEYPGWSTEAGVATIALQAPLPQVAPWDKHYIEDPIVQWSFFPLGLSSRGGLPIKNPKTGEIEHVIGIDVDGSQRKYCEKNGIVVGPDIVASPMTLVAGVTGGGKSVAQWNFMNACLARPKEWLLFGIDMKKVELSQLRKYGVKVGTTYDSCKKIATFVQKTMMDRYELMEQMGINNWGDVPQEQRGPAIFLLCDELGELLAPIAGKDEASKENQEAQDLIRAALESIARLGRASRVFLLGAAQRPSSDIIPMQIRQNMSNKIAAGTIPATISGMLFENTEGARIPGNPRGRCAIKIHSSEVNHYQGFFSPTDWIEKYRAENGLPIEIYSEHSNESKAFEGFEENEKPSEEQLSQKAMTREEFDDLSGL